MQLLRAALTAALCALRPAIVAAEMQAGRAGSNSVRLQRSSGLVELLGDRHTSPLAVYGAAKSIPKATVQRRATSVRLCGQVAVYFFTEPEYRGLNTALRLNQSTIDDCTVQPIGDNVAKHIQSLIVLTHEPTLCNKIEYSHNECITGYKCITDCECDGLRTCGPTGKCQGHVGKDPHSFGQSCTSPHYLFREDTHGGSTLIGQLSSNRKNQHEGESFSRPRNSQSDQPAASTTDSIGRCSDDCECDGQRKCINGHCSGEARATCSAPEHVFDETKTRGRCITDCECGGTRICNRYGMCQAHTCRSFNHFFHEHPSGTCTDDCQCDGQRRCVEGKCAGFARHCLSPDYEYDEGRMGGRCRDDCGCNGMRYCGPYGFCAEPLPRPDRTVLIR